MEILNRKARFDYEILDTYEAGIELTGTEIKSIRQGNANIKDCYGIVKNGEVFLLNMYIKEYAEGNFECNVYANSIGYLLLNLFGAVSTTSSSGKYTHAFTVAETNAHQSLTIGLADDTQDRQFALAMLDSLDVNASV